jgi:hypothetical protein
MTSPKTVTVAVTRADGGVTILQVVEIEYLTDGSVHKQYDVTPAYIDAIIAKHGWQGGLAPVSWRIVDADYPVEDRTFRNAWKDAGGARPGTDMPKAREIHRARLRKLRGNLLEQLDHEYQQADERGDGAAKRDIAADRQRLRDLPADPRIEAAQTPEELKALTIEVLNK